MANKYSEQKKEYYKNKKQRLLMSADERKLCDAKLTYDKYMLTSYKGGQPWPKEYVIESGTEFYQAGLEYMRSLEEKSILPEYMKETVQAWEDYCLVTDNNKIPTLPLSGGIIDAELKDERNKQQKRELEFLHSLE